MKKRTAENVVDSGSTENHPKKPISSTSINDPRNFARSYQIEALEKAMKQNTIVYLETGSGKTLIAIMLIRSYAHQLRKPSGSIAVFLVPTVHLVNQQAGVVITHTNLNVGKYWGELGVDFWDAHTWKNEIEKNEVLVMTPRILLDALRHGFFKLDIIKLLIFDECHNARGNSDYACILKEFYHPQLRTAPMHLPRIFGMTACLVKSKGATSASYAKQILDFENLMYSKVFTVVSESVLAEFVPFSTPKVKLYKSVDLPSKFSLILEPQLTNLKRTYVKELKEASKDSAVKNVSRLYEAFMYCLRDLGIWLACEAAKSLSSTGTDIYFWEHRDDGFGEKIVKSFSKDVLRIFSAHMPSGFKWHDGAKLEENSDAVLVTSRVNCLIESLMEYREKKDLRCIVFVERIIAAVALQSLLGEIFLSFGWSVSYMAGNRQGLKSQKRNEQLDIIDAFRKGSVNIIVATQILEEGLDVQRCNLVIRFDLSKTVCSFIQSRGRARMEGSDYLLIVKSGDTTEFSRINNYLASGEIMRNESLRHSSHPCALLENDLRNEEYYLVESTGALVTLNSSVSLLYYYCSQLPSDGYFKPTPRFIFDEYFKECTLYLPKSCPLHMVSVQGSKDILKKLVCLEACRKLHEIGALTDNLLPESVEAEYNDYHSGDLSFEEEQIKFFPGELVFKSPSQFEELYHCYSISMKPNFDYEVSFQNIILAVKCDLGNDFKHLDFELLANRGSINVNLVDAGTTLLNSEQVSSGMKFQVTVLSLLIDRSLKRLTDAMEKLQQNNNIPRVNYLLLPSLSAISKPAIIDWDCVKSLCFPNTAVCSRSCTWKCRSSCSFAKDGKPLVQTKESLVCRCMLKNSLVFTPHNGRVYCITGFLDGLDGNSFMESSRNIFTYKKYYKSQYGINLQHEGQSLLRGRPMFTVQNCLMRNKCRNVKESVNAYVELPPELCVIIISRIPLSTIYSFSFVPSIMHRVESILLAVNFKKLQTDHCIRNVHIPILKVLEAITTKKCQEEFSLESLETLGDSFLKYAVCQHIFSKNKHHHEGLLSTQKERLISNNALCKLGCELNVQGFIRHDCFNPKQWVIPGDISKCPQLDEVLLPTLGKIYTMETRQMKSKVVADVIESLIGAYLITGGESAAFFCMDWLGLKVDFMKVIPEERHFMIVHPEKRVDVNQLQNLLNYKFQDPSLLLEALTHGSYQLPDILRCYQRLEFLGDAVLDYLITLYMYSKYPGMSPGQLTDLRSSAVNNDCYAFAAVKAGLHKHILHMSSVLQEHINSFVNSFEQLSLMSTFGWESETTVPKALGDIIESLAAAIFVDSGFNKETVWNCIKPLLEPLVTPDTVKQHPVKELVELCQRESYENNIISSCVDGSASITVEVKLNGVVICSDTRTGMNKKTAKKLAAKTVLEKLKTGMVNAS